LIQAQYDAALQNPPWETKDDFDIDDRPKKKRRVSERWYFEVVYPEGMGPEDFQDPEETEEQTEQSPDLQVGRLDEPELPSSKNSPPAESSSQQTSLLAKTPDNDNSVDVHSANTKSLSKSRPREPSPQSYHSIEVSSGPQPTSLDEENTFDTITLVPQSPHYSEGALSLLPAASLDLALPAPKHTLLRPDLTTASSSTTTSRTTTSRPDILATSSPLSSLPSSPVLPSGSQLTALLNQPEGTYKESNFQRSNHNSSTDPSRERTLLRDDSGSKYSQSDDENTNFDSSQGSSRPLRNFKGRDLFDSIIWADAYSTSIFYMFITSFRQKVFNDVKSTSPTHKFIRTLRDGGRLVRNYTQNIDSLEEREGLATDLTLGPGSRARFHAKMQRGRRPSDIPGDNPNSTGVECVQLHGSLVSLRCGLCGKLSRWDEADRESITLSGQAPDCPSCTEYNARRTGRGRRGLAVGRLRPDIVLYGEEHPSAHLVAPLVTHDLGLSPDVLLIMGTSLKVHGLKILVKEFAKAVHTKGGKVIFVNRTKPPESIWSDVIDYWVECDCDAWVLDLKDRRGDIWLPQGAAAEETKAKRELPKEHSREEAVEAKPKSDIKKTTRPQATRDDKMSGVYHTFKILDLLWDLKDDRGQQASRPTYWQKASRVSIGAVPDLELSRRVRRGRPPKKEKNNATKAIKRRKSYPSCAQDENRLLEKVAFLTKQWEKLRVSAPGLPAKIPESVVRSGRVVLSELQANLPRFLQDFKFSFTPSVYSKDNSSYLPNLKGLSLPPQMSLISHPPSGVTLPLHSPRTVVEEKAVSHPYYTRTSHRFSSDSTLVGDGEFSAEDTIVVAPPLTPKTRRIKRMGSLGTILSSSPEIYHDAQEGPDDAGSGTSQEYHDAIEWRPVAGI
jgi:NAD-dependent SIR2 family protein deacetylase